MAIWPKMSVGKVTIYFAASTLRKCPADESDGGESYPPEVQKGYQQTSLISNYDNFKAAGRKIVHGCFLKTPKCFVGTVVMISTDLPVVVEPVEAKYYLTVKAKYYSPIEANSLVVVEASLSEHRHPS